MLVNLLLNTTSSVMKDVVLLRQTLTLTIATLWVTQPLCCLLYTSKAVTIEKGGAYIYTMRKDNAVEKRFIELGPEVGNNVVVERGLARCV